MIDPIVDVAGSEVAPARGAAAICAVDRESGAAGDSSRPIATGCRCPRNWWRQLRAESLGKAGQGSQPVAAVGPVDQHSQMQLFLDGPGLTLLTFVARYGR